MCENGSVKRAGGAHESAAAMSQEAAQQRHAANDRTRLDMREHPLPSAPDRRGQVPDRCQPIRNCFESNRLRLGRLLLGLPRAPHGCALFSAEMRHYDRPELERCASPPRLPVPPALRFATLEWRQATIVEPLGDGVALRGGACQLVPGFLFYDGFESGGAAPWSSVAP